MASDLIELTPAERKAIRALKRVAKNWPNSLWLFSGSGTLNVMRALPNGDHAHTADDGVDPDYALDVINIPNDGGDW